MIKKFQVLKIVYPDIRLYNRDAAKLRGFFANKHSDNPVFHNHTGEGFVYEYPRVQYKVVYGKPSIIAFESGIAAVYSSVLEENAIDIGGKTIEVAGVRIDLYDETAGDSERTFGYKFATPWLGLNQKNFSAYRQAKDDQQKKSLLDRVLVGNILSMCKGLGVKLENRISVQASLQETAVNFKNENMLGFYGSFTVNCRLPSYFGIGKSVSRGFGTIRKIKIEDKSSEMAGEEFAQGV